MALCHFVAFQNHRLTSLITCRVSIQQQGENEKEVLQEHLGECDKILATSGHISTFHRPEFSDNHIRAKKER